MPGYRRPHTTAFAPNETRGFDMLEKAFQGTQFRPVDASVFGRSKDLDGKRRLVPTTYADIPSSDEDNSEGSVFEEDRDEVKPQEGVTPPHEHLQTGLKPAARRLVTPPHLTQETSGLPPTPPTMANSDENEPRGDSLASNVQFADAVRNALHTQKSRSSTPGIHLPTPDPSPPGTSENLTAQSPATMLLHPLSRPHLRQYPSSRAESFHTAREDPSRSQLYLPQTPSPGPRTLSAEHCPTEPARCAKLNESPKSLPNGQALTQRDTAEQRTMTPTYSRRAQRTVSPYRTPESQPDLDKHISYISNEDEADYVHHESNTQAYGGLAGLALSIPEESSADQTSAEDVNNLIYKQIQEENVKRHSAISDGSAVPAGIYYSEETKAHKLKRAPRHQSLRNFSGSERSDKDSVDTRPKQLRHQKAQIPTRSLEASPIVEKSAVSQRMPKTVDEALEPAHAMTQLTQVAMTSANTPLGEIRREHKLRHASKSHRLEDEPALRRSSGDSNAQIEPTSLQSSPNGNTSTRKAIRHFSRDTQLDHNPSVRRTSAEHAYSSLKRQQPARSAERTLRHFSADTKLENNNSVRRTSQEVNHGHRLSSDTYIGYLPSSPRKSLDVRLLHPSTTPMSTSQLSDRTDAEVCEAKGISIYPHHNESLLVVQHGSRPVSKDTSAPSPNNYLGLTNQHLGIGLPLFPAHVQEPSPKLRTANPIIHVDSPLTNPRAAPEPPAIQFIPPTPSSELDRQLDPNEPDHRPVDSRPAAPQRRGSLLQRARRFSESFIEQPLLGRSFSLRKQQPQRAVDDAEPRPQNLSPMWRPQRFWDDYDSEDEEVEDHEDLDGLPYARLPPGGDTSSVESRRRKRAGLLPLPRNMSVRMPGFRGQGGFLLGNSLGLDRHGTNNRRHHVVVRKSSSGGMGSKGSYVSHAPGPANGAFLNSKRSNELRKRASEEMLRQMVGGKGLFTLPFSGGRKVQYVGVSRLRERMSQAKVEREERASEKRRAALRDQIQHGR